MTVLPVNQVPGDGSRCRGGCCLAFPLNVTRAEVREAAPRNPEAAVIDRMLRTLLPGSWSPAGRVGWLLHESDDSMRAFFEEEAARDADVGNRDFERTLGARYTCANLLPSGDCGIYDSRPSMCRRYPYGRGCDVPGCCWSPQAQESARIAEAVSEGRSVGAVSS